MIPLEYLGRDECGEIADIDGDPQGVARLADVGVRIGTKVRMVQGGSPCLCELGQTRVSLRLDRRVQVLVLPAS